MGIDDINAVQALLLMNVQNSEVSIRELVDLGYYIGSNVTYNVRHLVETDYQSRNDPNVIADRCASDRRKRAMTSVNRSPRWKHAMQTRLVLKLTV